MRIVNVFLVFILSASTVLANENVADEFNALEGFSDDAFEVVTTKEEPPSSEYENISLSGDLAFKTAYGVKSHKVDGVQYRGFNQAQTSFNLQLDAKLYESFKLRISGDAFYDAIYDLHLNTNYNDDILDAYKTQVRFNEVYIQGSLLDNLDMKLGRQIVIWGKSDSIRITDVINPLDNRLPGLTDIEDLRLPTTMLKLDYYLGDWEFSAMAIAENRIMTEAPPRSEFFNVDGIFKNAPTPFFELEKPDNSWENMQYAFAANGIFSGWDLSFYAADVLDQKWHIENNKRVISKVKMTGSALNIAYGSWLIKSELAYLSGVRYNTTKDAKNRLDTLFGLDFMGLKNTVISIEVANRHIFGYEKQMGGFSDYLEKNEMQSAIRYTQNFLNDTLDVSALLNIFGSSWEKGGFARAWLEYDVMDALNAEFGYVEYIGGDKPFFEINKDNDRLFANIKYSF
jgi:hypothetical protein